MWSGEGAVRFYAQGMGETRGARRLLRQAYLSSIPELRMRVVRRMYEMRFGEELSEELTLQQIRGREGVRVRTAYSQASAATGVQWSGRSFNRGDWGAADPVNRALSCANSCLYGVCHAAIVSAGYSTALGFIHTGKILSFVYDIADLYKADLTIPLSFQMVAESESELESRIRHALRDRFHESRFLSRIIPDIERALDVKTDDAEIEFDLDEAAPGGLWNGGDSSVAGGVNWADQEPRLAAEVQELLRSAEEKGANLDSVALGSVSPAFAAIEEEEPARDVNPAGKKQGTDEDRIDERSWDEGGQAF